MNDSRLLLRLPEVIQMTGLSRSTIYDAVKTGNFPAPIKLARRSSAWVHSEILDYVNSKIAARDKDNAA